MACGHCEKCEGCDRHNDDFEFYDCRPDDNCCKHNFYFYDFYLYNFYFYDFYFVEYEHDFLDYYDYYDYYDYFYVCFGW